MNDNTAQSSALTGSSHVNENPTPAVDAVGVAQSPNQEAESFDEFDPRGPLSGTQIYS